MTFWILFFGILFTIAGLSVAIWSIIDTRKKYYNEFVKKRRQKSVD